VDDKPLEAGVDIRFMPILPGGPGLITVVPMIKKCLIICIRLN